MNKADAGQAVGFQAAVTDWTGRYKPLRADGESYVAMWFWEHGYAAGERAGEAEWLADRIALGTDWNEALEAAVAQAVAEERARLVTWLREQEAAKRTERFQGWFEWAAHELEVGYDRKAADQLAEP